jgi:ankyrin repeat protein
MHTTITGTLPPIQSVLNNSSYQSLHEAIRNRNCSVDVIRNLLDPDNIDIKEEGQTPLLLSIEKGRLDIAKLLIENGANTNVVTEAQESLLHIAVFKGYQEIVEFLINQNENLINLKMAGGFTPLHLAVLQNQSNIARILLQHGGDLYAFENNGFNPFHLAIIYRNIEIATLFISSHPDIVDGLTHSELSPLDLAQAQGGQNMIILLRGDHHENLFEKYANHPKILDITSKLRG